MTYPRLASEFAPAELSVTRQDEGTCYDFDYPAMPDVGTGFEDVDDQLPPGVTEAQLSERIAMLQASLSTFAGQQQLVFDWDHTAGSSSGGSSSPDRGNS